MNRFMVAILLIGGVLKSNAIETLTFTNLLKSIDQHYPSIIAALRKREVAEGNALSAQGAFDTRLKLNSRNDPLGFYETRVIEALIEKPTRYRGTRFFGGWRQGSGLFPLQEEKIETRSGGEVLFGASTPLLRNGEIDSARADLRLTSIAVKAEQVRVERVRLLVQQAATAQMLQWQAASQKRNVRQELLDLALIRDRAIRDQVNIGDKAQVDVIDNQRLIATRRAAILAASQKVTEEAIKLSLYWRDTNGRPQVPSPPLNNTNSLFLSLLGERPSLGEALAKHPEVRIIDQILKAEGVNRKFSENQLLPQLDLSVVLSKDLGFGSRTKQETEFRIGAFFELPFQNRKARGQLDSVRSRIAVIEQELRLTTDQLHAAAKIAENKIQLIQERLRQLEERLKRAQQMRKAETERVELQLSDLLRLNLREQDVTAAQTELVDGRLELRLAELDWAGALAVDLLQSSAD